MTLMEQAQLPNQWDLYDMHGNVWEWCLDDWVEKYNEIPLDGSVNYFQKEDKKSLRGGSWLSYATDSCSISRYGFRATLRVYDLGFRLLRTLP